MANGTSLIPAPKWYMVAFIVASLEHFPPFPLVIRYLQREENEKLAVDKSLTIFKEIFYNEKRKQYIDPDGAVLEMIGSFYLEIKEPFRTAIEEAWLEITAFAEKDKDKTKGAKDPASKKGATIHKFPQKTVVKKDPPTDSGPPKDPTGGGKKT